MKGSDQNKKPSANEENTSFISRASYWSPSIGAGIPFIISLRYLPQSTDPNQASIHYSNYYMQDEEEADFGYQYYLPYIPVIILGSFFVSTFFCNSIFGRASNRDSHHNPFYHQIIQGAGDYMPAASAVLYSIFRFGASSVGGERSKAIEGLISKALAALNIVSRLDNKVDESYDYRMDRSPLLDGNVRRIEYVDIVIRDGVVYVVEGLLHGAYYAMEMGVTRIAVNDANRLYIITGLYSGADILEESLIYLLNQFTHYAERIADFRAISLILRSIGVADPSKPIKAVTPKAIDEVDKKIAEEIRELNEAAKQFGNKLKEGAQHLGEDLKEGAEQLGEEIKEGVKKMGDNLHNIGEDIQESFESIGDGLARAFNHSHRSSSSSATAAPKGLHKDDLEHKATNSNSAAEAASTAEKKGLPKDERNYEDKKSSSSSSEVAADSSEVISHQNTIYDLINHIDVFIQMMNGNYEEGKGEEEGEEEEEEGFIAQVIHDLTHNHHATSEIATNTEGFAPFTQVANNPNGSMTGTLSNGAMINFPTTPNANPPELGILARFTDHTRNLGHVGDIHVFSYYDANGNIVIMIGDVEMKISPGDHHS